MSTEVPQMTENPLESMAYTKSEQAEVPYGVCPCCCWRINYGIENAFVESVFLNQLEYRDKLMAFFSRQLSCWMQFSEDFQYSLASAITNQLFLNLETWVVVLPV